MSEDKIKMPSILICATQYPGYGGVATIAYSFIKYLRHNNYNTCGLFYNRSKANCDPNDINGVFLLKYKKTAYDIYIKNIKDDLFDEQDKINTIENIVKYLDESPKIIFCIGNGSSSFSKQLFPSSKIIFGTSGIVYYKSKLFERLSLTEYLEKIKINKSVKNESYGKQEIDDLECSNIIVPNSDIMIDVYNTTYPEFQHKITHQYFDTTKYINHSHYFDKCKKYIDIIIISSRLNRLVKNNLFLYSFFEKCNKYKKCFVGENNDIFLNLPNSIFTGLISHDEVYTYLSRSKLLIIPSLFESSNNTAREAYGCKCLILTSNNVGFHKKYPEYSICTSFDINEWEQKAIYLLDNYHFLIDEYKIDFCDQLKFDDLIKMIL